MMIKEKINNALRSRAFYIVFSILASFALWTYVAYIENPDVTVPVSGIKVEFVGEDSLTDNDLIITGVDTDKIVLRFTGKRNNVSQLSSTNLTVTVDMTEIANIGVAGVYQLSYTVNYPDNVTASGIYISGASVDYITVTVEKLVSEPVIVKGVYNGDVEEGYEAEPLEFDPEMITVSGPESEISQISYAWVEIERDNLSKTLVIEMPYTLMDEDGNEVPTDNLILSSETVVVTVPVVMIKEIPLTVNLAEGAGATEKNTIVSYSPETITLSGDADILNDINLIELGTVDLTSFTASTTLEFPIMIPNGTENLTGETMAVVTCEITGLETRDLISSNIQDSNVTEGYSATVITQSLPVTIRGKEGIIDEVSASNIRIVADLSELGNTTGVFTVTAKVYVDGYTEVGAVGEYKVSVSVTET